MLVDSCRRFRVSCPPVLAYRIAALSSIMSTPITRADVMSSITNASLLCTRIASADTLPTTRKFNSFPNVRPTVHRL
ncbi:hypothetical protein PISMIDRAFT_19465 [Pisolithus microcarpus 441]|uniref:Uncharacterized protein n=1 Tax=Pisolithus microcarpus 441 TaxID=765257 RepID=A0A0C9Y350_9AGAM|nr:hypothetical protein PISMIDRAFT_19465 [Pisolithus microcarpus 441]